MKATRRSKRRVREWVPAMTSSCRRARNSAGNASTASGVGPGTARAFDPGNASMTASSAFHMARGPRMGGRKSNAGGRFRSDGVTTAGRLRPGAPARTGVILCAGIAGRCGGGRHGNGVGRRRRGSGSDRRHREGRDQARAQPIAARPGAAALRGLRGRRFPRRAARRCRACACAWRVSSCATAISRRAAATTGVAARTASCAERARRSPRRGGLPLSGLRPGFRRGSPRRGAWPASHGTSRDPPLRSIHAG
jgi:hypothetical protein